MCLQRVWTRQQSFGDLPNALQSNPIALPSVPSHTTLPMGPRRMTQQQLAQRTEVVVSGRVPRLPPPFHPSVGPELVVTCAGGGRVVLTPLCTREGRKRRERLKHDKALSLIETAHRVLLSDHQLVLPPDHHLPQNNTQTREVICRAFPSVLEDANRAGQRVIVGHHLP